MVETINLLIREKKQLKLINEDIRTYKEKVRETKQNIKDIKLLEQKQNKVLNDEFENISFETAISVNENFIEYCKSKILESEFLKEYTKVNIANYKEFLK